MTIATLLLALMPVQDLDWVYVSTDPMGMDADGANLLDRDPFGFDSWDVDLFDLDPFSEDPLGVVPWGEDPTMYYSQMDPFHSSDPLGSMGVPNYGWGLGNTSGGMAAAIGGWGVGFDGQNFGVTGGGYGLQFGMDPEASSFGGGDGGGRFGGFDRGGGGMGRGMGPGMDADGGMAQYGLGAASILEYSRLMLNRGQDEAPAATAPTPMLRKAEAQNVMDSMLSPVTRRHARATAAEVLPTPTQTTAPTPVAPAAGTPAARVHQWFQTLDGNHDGGIDDAEFRAGTLLSSHVFRRVDVDGNSLVDVAELRSYLLEK